MPQVPVELQSLRDIWRELNSLVKVNQASVARRSGTIARLVPGMVGAQRNKRGRPKLSTAYVSRLLNETEHQAPSSPILGTFALAMEAAFQSVRGQLSQDAQDAFEERFTEVLASLELSPTEWGDTEQPLGPFSENLIVDERFEADFAWCTQSPRFGIAIEGGYRVGKSTQLLRAIQYLKRNNYKPTVIQLGTVLQETDGLDQAMGRIARQLGGTATSSDQLDDVVEKWLKGQPPRTVLVFEEANALAAVLCTPAYMWAHIPP